MPKQRRKCGETCTKFACPESTGPVQGVLRPCTLKPMQCPKGATQQTRPRSTTPVLAAGPKQHVPGGFSSSTPPQGGTPSGNLREEAPQGRHGRPAPTDVANAPHTSTKIETVPLEARDLKKLRSKGTLRENRKILEDARTVYE